jgi:UDP-glucuronate decarboxylase
MDMPFEFTGPVNLGNPVERSILDMAVIIKNFTGSSSPIVYKPLPIDDPLRRCPDITLARNMLDWKPSVSLEEGLVKTIAYFEDTLHLPKINLKYRANNGAT